MFKRIFGLGVLSAVGYWIWRKFQKRVTFGKNQVFDNPANGIDYLDFSNEVLPNILIESDKFRDFTLNILDWYANPDAYEIWYKHNIPKEVYFNTTNEEKLDNFGLAYFTFHENSNDDSDFEQDREDRNRLIGLAKNRNNPYWYMMGHTCHHIVYLEYLIAKCLRPEIHWYVIFSSEHSFVCNVTAKELINRTKNNIIIVDMLIDEYLPHLMKLTNHTTLDNEHQIRIKASELWN